MGIHTYKDKKRQVALVGVSVIGVIGSGDTYKKVAGKFRRRLGNPGRTLAGNVAAKFRQRRRKAKRYGH